MRQRNKYIDDHQIDAFRKRLTRAGYYNIRIHTFPDKDKIFLTCFDVYGEFHYLFISKDDLCLLPKSTISLEKEL